jgi:uncharacterized short protein YbdD (DUF466 family)
MKKAGLGTRDSALGARVASALHRMLGAPEYERYVEHLRAHHPDVKPLPRDEFARQRLVERYGTPGARCC